MAWQKFFAEVPDFRLNGEKPHKLSDILMLSLCAVLSGADDFEEMQNKIMANRKRASCAPF